MLAKDSMPLALVVFSLSIAWLIPGCVPASVAPTPAPTVDPDALLPTAAHHTIEEVEQLAGFDVKVPRYLPPGVSLDFAT